MTAIGGSAFDLFDDLGSAHAERGGARQVPVRRLTVLLAAGTLLVGGGMAARASIDATGAAPERVAPATLFRVLAEPQRDVDVLAEEPGTALLDPTSTRLLGETSAGSHYLAVHATGLVCLVTVPVGDVAELGCTDPVASDRLLTVEVTEPEPHALALVPDGLAPAADGSTWERVGPNLYVRDGAPARP